MAAGSLEAGGPLDLVAAAVARACAGIPPADGPVTGWVRTLRRSRRSARSSEQEGGSRLSVVPSCRRREGMWARLSRSGRTDGGGGEGLEGAGGSAPEEAAPPSPGASPWPPQRDVPGGRKGTGRDDAPTWGAPGDGGPAGGGSEARSHPVGGAPGNGAPSGRAVRLDLLLARSPGLGGRLSVVPSCRWREGMWARLSRSGRADGGKGEGLGGAGWRGGEGVAGRLGGAYATCTGGSGGTPSCRSGCAVRR